MSTYRQESFYSLESVEGKSVALKSVEVVGKVEGWTLTKTIRQRYRNDERETIEVVYSFPLAYNETLLSMTVTINGKNLSAQVMERKTAAQKYEKAIEDGDSPIMVEIIADGIASVNLGNLPSGTEVELKIVSALPLHFTQGSIRLMLPSTIAPRYGDPIRQGGLREHDAIGVDLSVEYPLNVRVELEGVAANAALSSPSHSLRVMRDKETTIVTVAEKAFLDRDFILILDNLTQTSTALFAQDGKEYMAQATFYPPLADNADAVTLKILVDCSGSMGGDSITTAKRALKRIASELNELDFVSYSRFGSTTQHDFSTPKRYTDALSKALNATINATDANLGGTDMEGALLEVFKLKCAKKSPPTCVLLITDGEIWSTKSVIDAAVKSNQRVFVIGVGASAAEHLLRDLAKQTGGACEMISPNEAGEEAIARMFYRMRGAELKKVEINWGQTPLWQSKLPLSVYGGETLHIYAQFKTPLTKAPILSYINTGGDKKTLSAEAITQTQNPMLTRLGGARRHSETTVEKKKLALSLRYQLLTPQTALFLVYEQAKKISGTPTLHQVPQMLAAGWGGTGTINPLLDGALQALTLCRSQPDDKELYLTMERDLCAVGKLRPRVGRELKAYIEGDAPSSNNIISVLTNVRKEEFLTLYRNENLVDELMSGGKSTVEKVAKHLLLRNSWLNFTPPKMIEAKRHKVTPYRQELLGQHYADIGEIIAIDIYVGEECDSILIGYDTKKGVLAIIAPNEDKDILLTSVLKCYSLCKVVNRKKLLRDLGLPTKTKFVPVVLANKNAKIEKKIKYPFSALLIEKLGVVIVLK
ncbi:MAG: VIT and VWA domain-containing protein [Campylobacteraceae bacterium]|nr:VIT and VWA domain-containing protein [Campylobacteraceae bacterium]